MSNLGVMAAYLPDMTLKFILKKHVVIMGKRLNHTNHKRSFQITNKDMKKYTNELVFRKMQTKITMWPL